MKQNDKKVEEWLSEYGDYLYGYAIKKVHDKDVAFDLVQETLLGAWKANFNGDSSVKTWLISILKHKIIDYIRKQIRNRELISELRNDPSSDYFDADGSWLETQHNLQDTPDHQAQNNQLQQHLMQCISSLNEQQRTIFILREVNGESTADICKTYGITASNVHVIMHRARLTLCKSLSDMGYSGSSGVCRTYEKSTRQLLLRCSTSCIHAVVRGRDNGLKHPDLSLYSYHYTPQNHAIFDSFPHLLATITLSPTDS